MVLNYKLSFLHPLLCHQIHVDSRDDCGEKHIRCFPLGCVTGGLSCQRNFDNVSKVSCGESHVSQQSYDFKPGLFN